MARSGSLALLVLAALAAVLTLRFGPRPVRELWYAEELTAPRSIELFPEGLPPPAPGEGTEAFLRALAAADGIAADALPPCEGEGGILLDADCDGDLDAVFPPAADGGEPAEAAASGPIRVWWNDENRGFREVGGLLGPAVTAPRRLDRAAPAPIRAVDPDRDGRVDLLLALEDGRRLLLWNRLAPRNHLRVRLVPVGGGPPEAVARVEVWPEVRPEVRPEGRRQVRLVPLGGEGGEGAAAEAHFGLGDADRVEAVEVLWPSGRRSSVSDVPAPGEIEIAESAAIVEPGEPDRRGEDPGGEARRDGLDGGADPDGPGADPEGRATE